MSQQMVFCSRPECQTTAGCKCRPLATFTYENFETAASRKLDEIIKRLERIEQALIKLRFYDPYPK